MSLKNPYLIEGIKVSATMSAGDVISQMFIEKKRLSDWDYMRSLRFGALGFFVVTPILRKWFNILDRVVAKDQPRLMRGLKKVCIHQAIFTAPFNLFISYLTLFINGHRHDQIMESLNEDYFDIIKYGFLFWTPAQLINFSILPLRHQVMYVQGVALIWNSYLSWLLNKNIK